MPLVRGAFHSSTSTAADRELTPKPSTSQGQQSYVDTMASQDSGGGGAGSNAGASSAGAGSGGGARPRDDGSNLPPGAAGERG